MNEIQRLGEQYREEYLQDLNNSIIDRESVRYEDNRRYEAQGEDFTY